jgi:hypothetical protein
MTLTDYLMIAAIILGPVLAVQAQKWIEWITRVRQDKKQLFITLMATRGRTLHQDHVQALNMIDIVYRSKGPLDFYLKKSKRKDLAVIEAWSELRDALYNGPTPPWATDENPPIEALKEYQPKLDSWSSECDRLRIQLLNKMAAAVGYHFDAVTLKKGSYNPQAYADIELAQTIILHGLKQVALGSASIPIHITASPDMNDTPPTKSESPSEPKKKPSS